MNENPSATSRQDYTVSMLAANLYGLAIGLPVVLVFSAAYTARWGVLPITQSLQRITNHPLAGMAWFLAGILAHEWLHGISWAVFGKLPLSAIKFGFQWKTLTPYAHVRQPIEVNAYRMGALTSGLLLGVLPYLAGLLGGNADWMIWGTLFTFAAYRDFLVLWLIRRVPRGSRVEDHPTLAGCSVLPAEDSPGA